MRTRGLIALGIGAILFTLLVPPFGAVGAVMLGIVTIVFAVRAIRATRPQPRELLTPEGVPITVMIPTGGRGGAVTGLILGIAATCAGAIVLVAFLVFANEIRAYDDCRSDANTTQGEDKCWDQLRDSLNDRIAR